MINDKKHSVAIVSMAVVLFLVLVSSASAFSFPPLKPIYFPKPVASFTVSSPHGYYGCYSQTELIYFTDTSKGLVTSWHWDFGDGYSSNLQNPSHKYDITSMNSFIQVPITLTVTNNYGFTSTTKKELTFYCIY